jgi:hypothetical protein
MGDVIGTAVANADPVFVTKKRQAFWTDYVE